MANLFFYKKREAVTTANAGDSQTNTGRVNA